jgi:hypothetical protein
MRKTRSLSGLLCLAELACSPDPVGESDTGIQPVATTDDSTSGDSTSDGDGYPMCVEDGWICAEFGVCQCTDLWGDCGCEPVECTEDSHCADDQTCEWVSGQDDPVLACVPNYCMRVWDIQLLGDTDPSIYKDEACADAVVIEGTPWTQLPWFENLHYVHKTLNVRSNPMLTSIAGLAGLQEIVGGGAITDNPQLPTADVEALLAQIPGGDAVLVCGNLDGEPC